MIALDSLLLRFSSDGFDLREDFGQRGRVRRRFVGGDRVRHHARVLESGTKESRRGFGIAVLPEQDFDDLSMLVNGETVPKRVLPRF